MPSFGPLISQREIDRGGVDTRKNPRPSNRREDEFSRSDDRGAPDPQDNDISLGSLMRGLGGVNEPPVSSDEELNSRAQRNASFLQQPEIQAALVQFAVSIMQPLGSGANWGDFAGAFGQAVGSGVQAAGSYQTAQDEEYNTLLDQDLKEREMLVREGNLSLSEQELAEKLKTGKLKQRSMIINGANTINDMYELGLGESERAKVLVTYDENGEVVSADLEQLYEDKGEDKESKVSQLEREADAAEAGGDTALANRLRQAAAKEATGENTANIEKGIQLVPDENAPGGVRIVEIPGGAAEQEAAEADEATRLKKQSQLGKAMVINSTVDSIHQTIAGSISPDILITGGIGGLSALMPHPTDARMVEQWLETIRANVGFDELQKMRDASPTGGALGQVAIQENIWLQSVQGSLERTQKPEELMKQLLTVKYLYDPAKVEWRGQLSEAVKSGDMEESAAIGAMQTDLMEFIYPELKPEPLNWNEPPEYITDEQKQLWEIFTPTEKFMFFDEKDRSRVMTDSAGGRSQ